MAQDGQYKSGVIEDIKQNSSIDIKMITEGMTSDITSGILNIWRTKPSSLTEARKIYSFENCFYIDDFLGETNLSKIKLPLLSKSCCDAVKKEDIENL